MSDDSSLREWTEAQVQDWMQGPQLNFSAEVLSKFEGISGALLEVITKKEWSDQFEGTKTSSLKVSLSWTLLANLKSPKRAASKDAAAQGTAAADEAPLIPKKKDGSNGVGNGNVGDADEGNDTDALDLSDDEREYTVCVPENIVSHRNSSTGWSIT